MATLRSRHIRNFGMSRWNVGVSTFAALAAAVALTAGDMSPMAHAGVIVSDDFNIAALTSQNLPGRTPDLANLPGGVWGQVAGFSWGLAKIDNGQYASASLYNAANTNQNGTGIAVSLASAGAYVKPSQLTISADLYPTLDGVAYNNLSLGFYSSTQVLNGYSGGDAHFTGLNLKSDGGLSLIVNGSQVGSAIAYGGTFTDNGFYTLSYSINTADGSISNIHLQGSTATYGFATSAFTDAATAYAGIYASGPQNANGSGTDNFVVSTVPEPATLGLLALGGLGLLARRRRNG